MAFLKISLNATHQNALLDVLEYALLCAESEINSHTFFEVKGGPRKYIISEDWDPEDLGVWLDLAPELAKKLDAMKEIIENAEALKLSLAGLVGENLESFERRISGPLGVNR